MKITLAAALLLASACGPNVVAERSTPAAGAAGEGGTSGGEDSLGLAAVGNQAGGTLPFGLGYGTSNDHCSQQTGCDVVIIGELQGAPLNHGFIDNARPRVGSDSFIDQQALVAHDGFLAVATPDEPLNEDVPVRPLEGGLFRLPSSAQIDAETWFCIDGGTSRRATNDRMLLTIDAISSLGSRASATPGEDWLQTDLEGDHAPVTGRFNGLSPLYANQHAYGGDLSGGMSTEVGFGTDPETVTDPWRLIGRYPSNVPDPVFTDLILISTRYVPQPWSLAFPGLGSSVGAADAPSYVDLQDISTVASCPGSPVAGTLQIHVRIR